jgi:hypothetical protein
MVCNRNYKQSDIYSLSASLTYFCNKNQSVNYTQKMFCTSVIEIITCLNNQTRNQAKTANFTATDDLNALKHRGREVLSEI